MKFVDAIIKGKDRLGATRFRKKACALLGSVLFASSALGNPVLDNVAAGTVSVQQTATTTTVTQESQKAILNWNSFNIGQNEATAFQQPAGGVALNRINPQQGASSIYGSLTATGQIILVNPAGIYFGPSAYVNVGGLIATTGSISDQNFLNGQYQFTNASAYPNASIINEGQIIAAEYGLVALAAPRVENRGLIQANSGSIVLASGNAFTVNFEGNELINFTVDEQTQDSQAGVSSNGALVADGGRILMTAKAAKSVLDNVINLEGVAQVRSVSARNGEIILSSDPSAGRVRVAAKVNASGKGAGQRGGNVTVTGYNILLDSPAVIDVSGDLGAGNILIGGNYQGRGPLPNSNSLLMASGASLLADALTNGNGGTIILWSNGSTRAYGSISAKGGSLGGNGGFVETSGHYLDINGIQVNTLAANGSTGTWLLDPSDVTIQSNGGVDSNESYSAPNYTPTSGASVSIIDVGNLQTSLASSNVTVTTTSSGVDGVGNITVASPITWSSSNALSLVAANNIYLNAGITATSGTLNLTAANTSQSITTNSSGTVNVGTFNLLQGQWYQNTASLPSFAATNFRINSGVMPNASTQFIRVTSGAGTGGSPYVVTDVYGLQGIGSTSTTLGNSWQLGADINASGTSGWNSGAGFVPIGTSSTAFTGTFNGQNHSISNLTINRPGTTNVGLFGYTTNATVSNLSLINANVIGGDIVGVAIGYATGASSVVDNVSSSGSLTGVNNLGGLIGANAAGTVSNSHSSVTMTATGFSVGGLLGYTGGNVSNSYATGDISSNSGNYYIGGLVGYAFNGGDTGTISHSYATGNVFSMGGADVGGFIGHLQNPSSVISDSYSTGSVTANNYHVSVGGFAGFSGGTVLRSYSTGLVTSNGTYVGGLVGAVTNGGAIQDSFTLSPVNGAGGSGVGGLVGYSSNATITDSYSTGYVTGSTNVGGFLGIFDTTTFGGNSYFNTETSGKSNAVGSGGAAPIFGLTTAQAMQSSNYSGWGFGGGSTWNIISGTSYPYLNAIFTSTPRVISGASSGSAGDKVTLVSNGTVIDNAYAGSNGAFYFLERNGAIADSSNLLIYQNGTNKGNLVVLAPTSNGSQTGLTISTNTVRVGGADTEALSTSALNSAYYNSSGNVLYSVSGNNLTLNNNISLNTTSGTTVTTNGNITTSGTGSLTFNGPLTLGAATVLTTADQTINLAGTINGAYSLAVNSGTGGITFGGIVGGGTALTSLSATGGSIAVNGGSVTTTGNQSYNNSVNLGVNTILTSTGNGSLVTIDLTHGVTGNKNLTINGGSTGSYNINLGGTLALGNVTIAGSSTNDTFTLDTGAAQSWTINGSNSGSLSSISGVGGTFGFSGIENLVGGSSTDSFTLNGGTLSGSINGASGTNTLTGDNVANTWAISGANAGAVTGVGGFSNIQNLTGGNSNNNFVFSDNASVSGTINGTSLSATNTLDYSAYSTAVSVNLSSTNSGYTENSSDATVSLFSNINQLTGNSTSVNTLILPNKSNSLVITGAKAGYVNDPIYFNQFGSFVSVSGSDAVSVTVPSVVNQANGTITINGVVMSFTGGFTLPSTPAPAPTPTPSVPTTTSSTTASASEIPNIPAIVYQASFVNIPSTSSNPFYSVSLTPTDLTIGSQCEDRCIRFLTR